MHGCIVCISFARQVGIYHSPYGCEAVWKPPELCSDLSSTDMFSKLYAFVLNSLRIDNRSRSSLSANALCAADYALQDLHKFTDVSTTADHNWKVAWCKSSPPCSSSIPPIVGSVLFFRTDQLLQKEQKHLYPLDEQNHCRSESS